MLREGDGITLIELKIDLEKQSQKYVVRRHIWGNSPYMCNTLAQCAEDIQIYDVARIHILTSEANLFGLLQSVQI